MAASDAQVVLACKQYHNAYAAWDEVFKYSSDLNYLDAWFDCSLGKFVSPPVLFICNQCFNIL